MGLLVGCSSSQKEPVTFMVANPGHFHAALVLKQMYPSVEITKDSASSVFVFAPDGDELEDFLNRVEGYNQRVDDPTHWNLDVYRGNDFFHKMLESKPGKVVVLAGNNEKKTEYILEALKAGLHVYSDKPMAINPEDYLLLERAFQLAETNGLLLYDIMTERFEITSILQKELMQLPNLFGTLQSGSEEEPAVVKESVHHFFKYVSGAKLKRPPWFFDVEQEGEGTVDVTTHLVDLVQWACFPGQVIQYDNDIELLNARRSATLLTRDQFTEVTGLARFPDYLGKDLVNDTVLAVYCNGEIDYTLKGIHVRVKVNWNFQAPEGGGDTHVSVVRGSKSNLKIRQGAEQDYRPELYIITNQDQSGFSEMVHDEIIKLASSFPGLVLEEVSEGWRVIIPDQYRVGHEAHFAQVTARFLGYLSEKKPPEWEAPNMLARYRLTTSAYELSRKQ